MGSHCLRELGVLVPPQELLDGVAANITKKIGVDMRVAGLNVTKQRMIYIMLLQLLTLPLTKFLLLVLLWGHKNRLELIVENLGVSEENMTMSLSQIQDTDMAGEMAEYTRTNVLTQSATAMLGKANELPNTILQLIQA
ncbi:hypothetical protein AN639_06840 [Candidatus Epulonipiscium fishelsonii]|nr:hypothetical protein AN639_06840 [Epulopiscium sp. SCG-B05WGA-EpuloA1]